MNPNWNSQREEGGGVGLQTTKASMGEERYGFFSGTTHYPLIGTCINSP